MRRLPGVSYADRRVRRGFRLRAAALLPLGVLAVHQGRYLLGYGDHAGRALAEQGHAYLTWAGPLMVLLAAGAAAEVLLRALAAWTAPAPDPAGERRRTLAVWLGLACALFVIYGLQESVEGLVASGHPTGLAALFGHGGWTAVPLALAMAGALVLALRLSDGLESRVAAGRAPGRRLWPAIPALGLPGLRTLSRGVAWRRAPLVAAWAGRAPPARRAMTTR